MSDAPAEVKERRRISGVWIVPLAAALLGVWMVIHTIRNEGPEINIRFRTAAGIEPGKTRVKMRDVEIGLVESVGFGEGWESVEVIAQLDKSAEPLLREDTQFWTVRPRIGAQGVSGIGTLLSGAYIELEPGVGEQGRREFVGLERPPVTPAGEPGLKIVLESERAGSVGAGDPVLYRGFAVGRIETADFERDAKKMRYGAFIRAPYDDLITTSTRFWDVSGLRFRATSEGIELATPALDTLLRGGVTFGIPKDFPKGRPAQENARFRLHVNEQSAALRPYEYSIKYVLEFEESVRGLLPGAPVEYRGVPIGEVERVMLVELAEERRAGAIPVLIRIEPARASLPDSQASVDRFAKSIADGVETGLRASLGTGNLVTGSRYIAVDFHPGSEPARMGTFAELPTIPTIPAGLEGIQQQVTALLTKLTELPLEEVAASAARAIDDLGQIIEGQAAQGLPDSLEATMAEARRTLQSVSEESVLQERLLGTLTELDRTLVSLRSLLETLDDQPNSVIFSKEATPDLIPPAGKP